MKKALITIIVVLLSLGAIFLFFRNSTPVTNYPSQGKSIVALGDSLVEGVGATTGNEFPSVLSRLIGEPIINLGISGNTSSDGLARINEVIDQDPKIVLVLLGGNDFLRNVEPKVTFQNINKIISQIHESGAIVILLGVRGGIFSDQYEEYFNQIAKDSGSLYVPDVLDGLFGNSTLMSDAIHPNDAGYAKIAQKVLPVIKKVLH